MPEAEGQGSTDEYVYWNWAGYGGSVCQRAVVVCTHGVEKYVCVCSHLVYRLVLFGMFHSHVSDSTNDKASLTPTKTSQPPYK